LSVTDPALARIGFGQTEAEAERIATCTRVFTNPRVSESLRARRLVSNSDRILGFTAFGVAAGEILATVQIAMIAGLPYTASRDAVLTHPTLVEGLIPLFSSCGVNAQSCRDKKSPDLRRMK
jgi:pyruvate/2-oxoglutarate dehydrogenase complex dihydrolipoamide dehydrogenase (E3) component